MNHAGQKSRRGTTVAGLRRRFYGAASCVSANCAAVENAIGTGLGHMWARFCIAVFRYATKF